MVSKYYQFIKNNSTRKYEIKKNEIKKNEIKKNDNCFIPNNSTPENEIKKLNNCQCCKRHTINRPIILQVWTEYPYKDKINNYINCTCDCRHKIRWICRKYS